MLPLPDLKGRFRLTCPERLPVIREADLLEATLHVLAVAGGYRPGIFIPGWAIDPRTNRSILRDRVLRAIGINPDDPDTFPGNTKGPYELAKGQRTLYRTLDYGPTYTQGTPHVSLKAQMYKGRAFTVKGRPENGGPPGSWALTEAGVAVAARVHSQYMLQPGMPKTKFMVARNLTCVWLDAQIRHHGLYDRLCDSLSQLQQIKKEVDAGEIRDHVNHWFSLAIKRDGLRTRLEAYDPPPFRQIRDWVLRAVWTTLRSRAQDADTRTTYGALTERERSSGSPAVAAMTNSSFVRIIQTSEDSNEVSEDLVDSDAHARETHAMDFHLGMKEVERAFETLHPGNAKRLSRMFRMMASGATVSEMAEDEDVSRHRMASILGAVRGALRDAQQTSGDLVTTLEFIQENPWSTQEDLREILPLDDAGVKRILAFLVREGRLTQQTFKHGVGYITTDSADAFLTSRDPTDPIGSILL